MMESSQRVLCSDVYKTFIEAGQHIPVLVDVNLVVNAAQKVAIVGSSGSGKSTLLHILSGLDQATEGSVSIMGQTLATLSTKKLAQLRNQHIGMIYQFHHLLPEFTAIENVAMPLRIAGLSNKHAHQQAYAMLERVGLSNRETHYPSMLSGGERQRVAIARALINKPSVVFADEPTGNLDQRNGQQIYSLFHEVTTELGTSVVMVTHDIGLAEQMDAVFTLCDGKLSLSKSQVNGK